jgi:hypothetical protein
MLRANSSVINAATDISMPIAHQPQTAIGHYSHRPGWLGHGIRPFISVELPTALVQARD